MTVIIILLLSLLKCLLLIHLGMNWIFAVDWIFDFSLLHLKFIWYHRDIWPGPWVYLPIANKEIQMNVEIQAYILFIRSIKVVLWAYLTKIMKDKSITNIYNMSKVINIFMISFKDFTRWLVAILQDILIYELSFYHIYPNRKPCLIHLTSTYIFFFNLHFTEKHNHTRLNYFK